MKNARDILVSTLSNNICVIGAALLTLLALSARTASAQTLAPEQRLCDPEYQDCRADILTFIAQENVEIDMGAWLIDDDRYTQALIAAYNRGVKIRLLMDPRCTEEHSACTAENNDLQAAGIPMRNRITSGILHWKMILFAGQGQLEFAGANFSPYEMTPYTPYQNYTDEVVFFTNDSSLLSSFMSKFDDLWTSTTEFANYANITGPLTRSYPTAPEDPQLNFPPDESYRNRAIAAYNAEKTEIDAAMFRITDAAESNAIINAINRGVTVRLYTDQSEYRDPTRLWDAYNVDMMYHAGAQVRTDAHLGINHEKAIILYSTQTAIFGSSNWTSPSTDSQREHNMFTTQSWIFDWLQNQFDRKWTNGSGYPESQPFTPLPPDTPIYNAPSNNGTAVPLTGVSLSWNAGLWGQLYDIYFGTSPTPPLFIQNQQLGPSQSSTDYRTYALPSLQPNTTYYWKIVSKTMAYLTAAGPVWSFTTGGNPTGDVPPTVAITSPTNGAAFAPSVNINVTTNASDSDGTVTRVDFYAGSSLIGTATSAPWATTWTNVPAGTYSLTAVATDNGGAVTTSSPVSITVASEPLPSGWTDADVGATGAAGAASYNSRTFTVQGAGADVWGTADAFNYAYLPLSGDGSMIARVATISSQASWVKAGVMIRDSLSPSAAQAFMLVSYAKGVAFQRRTTDGNTSVNTAGSTATAPHWVKIVRSGSTITGYESADGTTWTLVGSDTFTMPAAAYIGLAVSSHVAGTLATATFDNVTTTAGTSSTSPSVAITSPTSGATFSAPANITIAASASETGGTIAKVDFYQGTTLIGTATAAPYSVTWSNVPAGSYSLTAVATDGGSATATSSPVAVTVNTTAAPTVSITSPASGAMFTAPANIPITASASETGGTIAKVDFYQGTTLIGTATASPYSVTWSSAPAGSYNLTAVATDTVGTQTTSSAVAVTVNAASTLPAGWSQADIGAVPFAGSGSDSGGTFTVTGSGADVWGTADAFHYVYTNLSGDGTIIARVATVQDVAVWVKAGIMIRETLGAGSAQAFMLVSSAKGLAFQRRDATNSTSVNTAGPMATAPYWVKLTRSGNTFTAYSSPDGTTWTMVGTDTIPMATNVYVGLGVTSHTTSASATCTFDNVNINNVAIK